MQKTVTVVPPMPPASRVPASTNRVVLHAMVLLAGALLLGCVNVGPVTMPKAAAAFSPKQTYAVAYDKLWEATIAALDNNRIAVVSSSKESGTIQTDYRDGTSTLIIGGLAGAQSTRYKYNVALRNQSEGNVRLNVLCRIESTISNGQGSSQWTDVTGQNARLVKQLEDWLYEQVEVHL